MKKQLKLFFFVFFSLTLYLSFYCESFAKNERQEFSLYLGAFRSFLTVSSPHVTLDNLKGNTTGGAIGFNLGAYFAIEAFYQEVSYGEKVCNIKQNLVNSSLVDRTLGGSIRIYPIKYFNIRGGYANHKVERVLTRVDNGKVIDFDDQYKSSFTGRFGGAGFRFPYKMIDLYLDLTFQDLGNGTARNMEAGLRIVF